MKHSKLIFSAAVAVSAILGIGAASTADLPVKGLPYTAAPAYSWTGFYIGGTAGVGWGNEASDVALSTGVTNASPIVPGSYEKRMFGFMGGVEGGYNYQFNSLVVGVESDFSYANVNGSANANETFFPSGLVLCPIASICTTRVSYSEQQTLNWLATVRGRIGFLATPSWLIYGTGGWAVGNVRSSASANFANQVTQGGVTTSTPLIFSGSSSQIQNGWTVGGGTEYMLTRNWTGKVEYLYYDLGSVTLVGTNSRFAGIASTMSNMPVHGQTFRVGANYKF